MSPDEFDPSRERRAALLLWLPARVLLFGVGLGWPVISLYGLGDPWVLAGGAFGLVAVAPLAWRVAERWRRPLSRGELATSRRAAVDLGGGRTALAVVAGWLVLNGILALAGGHPFPLAFLWTSTTACSLLAAVVILGGRGLYQREAEGPSTAA